MEEFSVILSSPEMGSFSLIITTLKIFEDLGYTLKHVESRPATSGKGLECLITVNFINTVTAVEALRQLLGRQYTIVWTNLDTSEKLVWFPRNLNEVSTCSKALYKYGSELSEDHPGHGDLEYIERRKVFAEVAFNYHIGDAIPSVEYTQKELETWRFIYTHQKKYYPTNACSEQNEGIKLLEENAGYSPDAVPKLDVVSSYLKERTGYQLCPVVGWIHSRDFLALLAFRVFPCTQYIRHHSRPQYTPEPDICHELLGHIPLFCNPEFAEFSQKLGLASLGASDEWITKLSTLYWFTVEFGMVWEDGKPKAYGAGLLSSCEEIEHCVGDKAERRPLDCSEAVVTTYPETGLQPYYFIAKSIQEVKNKMTDFSKTIPKPFSISFNKETWSVQIS